jgi:hypothetical protein
MANDYSAVVLPELLLNIEQIFAESKRHELTLFEEPRTAVALLENQTATLDPIFKMDGGDYRCTGFSVAYQQADQNTIGSGGTKTLLVVVGQSLHLTVLSLLTKHLAVLKRLTILLAISLAKSKF